MNRVVLARGTEHHPGKKAWKKDLACVIDGSVYPGLHSLERETEGPRGKRLKKVTGKKAFGKRETSQVKVIL